jgi:hypothetical protein
MALRAYFHVCRQGLAADRPANPSGDWSYFATDTLVLSIYDSGAAAWRDFPAIFTLPLSIANGGTGQTTQTAAFNALDPLTTKGDLVAHDGTDSVRVPVGSNGQEIVADSSDAEGLVWRTTTVSKASDETTSSTTPVDIAGLSIPLAANRKYAFDIHLVTDSSSAGEANYFSVNGPASPTDLRYSTFQPTSNTGFRTDVFTAYDTANGLILGFSSSSATTIRGSIENGANAGNFVARFWTENGGAESARVRRGSWMRVWEIP